MPVTGGTCTFAAAIDPADANADTGITWSSSAPGVATVNASGVVSAVSAGDSIITATTDNGKAASVTVRVMPNVTALTFYTDKQSAGTVSYDMKVGTTIPMYSPSLTPAGAYNALTFSSSASGVAQIIENVDGSLSISGLTTGISTITATSHNGMTHSFVISVKPVLTNAVIPASHTMNINDSWTIPVTLTPAAGAFGDYILESSNPGVVRIEQNSKAFAVSPGTATISVKIDGATKSSCTITVNSPAAAANVGLKYYNVTYQSNGEATVYLGIIPVAGASVYELFQHVTYSESMTFLQLYDPGNILQVTEAYSAQAAAPVGMPNVAPGLRFFSIVAYDSADNIIDYSVWQVPTLYYPRNVGGASQAAADGYVMPMTYTSWIFMPDLWGPGYFHAFIIPIDPYQINLTFDKIPGADGYDIFVTNNGRDWGSANIVQPGAGTNRCHLDTGYIMESGIAIFNILPYAYAYDGVTKLYGEMRTVIFNVNAPGMDITAVNYWETPQSLNEATLVINITH